MAHPLALALAQRLRATQPVAGVLLLGFGSGRNVPPLRAAALDVTILEEDASRARAAAQCYAGDSHVRVIGASYAELDTVAGHFAAALSTHALLHGRPADIGATTRAVWERLLPGGPFFTTLGSTDDPRYGRGRRIDSNTYAAEGGREAGVAHAFFNRSGARALFTGFVMESLVKSAAAETAGRWAHSAQEAASLVHWFVRARKSARAVRHDPPAQRLGEGDARSIMA